MSSLRGAPGERSRPPLRHHAKVSPRAWTPAHAAAPGLFAAQRNIRRAELPAQTLEADVEVRRSRLGRKSALRQGYYGLVSKGLWLVRGYGRADESVMELSR
jgi:hypothetical protein